MLEDPRLDPSQLTAALRTAHGMTASVFTFIPGLDQHAASYEVATDAETYFLKVRFGAADDAVLAVPHALVQAGIPNVLAPITTRDGTLSVRLDGRTLILYAFVRGQNAVDIGLTDEQWRTFGRTLRAVHDSGLERRFADRPPVEAFSLPAAGAPVRRALELAEQVPPDAGPAAIGLAGFLRDNAERIRGMLAPAEELARGLRDGALPRVLCHADIHAANIVVTDDGGIVVIDWDGPMIAPRERDLVFVIGSRVARPVEPDEEERFFEGYGAVAVNPEAIVYYRYERIPTDVDRVPSAHERVEN